MHGRIFQISMTPVTEEKRIEEDRYFDGFVGRVADYVSEIEHPEPEYESLRKALGEAAEFADEGSFRVANPKKMFEKKHERFLEIAEKLSKTSLDDFASGKIDMDVFRLNEEYEDKYAYYVDDGDEWFGIVPLDEFVRGCAEKTDQVWHLGAVFDYHY